MKLPQGLTNTNIKGYVSPEEVATIVTLFNYMKDPAGVAHFLNTRHQDMIGKPRPATVMRSQKAKWLLNWLSERLGESLPPECQHLLSKVS